MKEGVPAVPVLGEQAAERSFELKPFAQLGRNLIRVIPA